MFGWSGCELYRSSTLASGEVKIPAGNSQGAGTGDQVRIVAGDWEEHARVVLDTNPNIDPAHRDHIQSGKWNGKQGASATYVRIGFLAIKIETLRTNRRTQIGLALAGLVIIGAYLAAATTTHGMVFLLDPWKRFAVAIGAIAALGTWYRDTLL